MKTTMRKLFTLFPVLLLLLAPAASAAVTLSPDCCGFTADFPVQPDDMPSAGSVMTASGATAPTQRHMFIIRDQPNYIVIVTADTFAQGTALDTAALYPHERDVFLQQFGGRLTDSRNTALQGEPAMTFTFDLGPSRPGGGGRALLVASRTHFFLVTVVYRGTATSDEKAALDAFIDSFRLR